METKWQTFCTFVSKEIKTATMNKLIRPLFLCLVLLASASMSGKSLVITLNKGTRVYYKITTDAPPTMAIAQDGTFTLNGQDYNFADVKSFSISATDYAGEKGTVDGIVALDEKRLDMRGDVRIYTLDGRLAGQGKDGYDMSGLKPGMYVITNGVNTLKIQKR